MEIYNRLFIDYDQSGMIQATGDLKTYNQEIQKTVAATTQLAPSMDRVDEGTRKVNVSFFGLVLASRAAMLAIRELEQTTGQKLPNTLKGAIEGFREFAYIVIAFALAGFPEIGILAGALLTLPPLLFQVDQATQDLSKSLDASSKKDVNAMTLALARMAM